jgi:uncharacterized membrane protein YkvA (DUF1232 family)
MKEKLKHEWITPERRHLGWWRQALEQLRLTWVLLLDNRVPLLHKLIPVVTLAYILSPIDIIPDMFIGLGMLDDLGILMLGISWFNSLAPGDVALEHLYRLRGGKPDITVTPEHIEDVTDQEITTNPDHRSASKRI